MNRIIAIVSFMTPARGISFTVCILLETTSSVNNVTDMYAQHHEDIHTIIAQSHWILRYCCKCGGWPGRASTRIRFCLTSIPCMSSLSPGFAFTVSTEDAYSRGGKIQNQWKFSDWSFYSSIISLIQRSRKAQVCHKKRKGAKAKINANTIDSSVMHFGVHQDENYINSSLVPFATRENWLFRWPCRSKRTWRKVFGAGCQISNGTGHNPGDVSTAYLLGKNRLCFVNELIVALLDQVVVLSQIDGLVWSGIALVRSLPMPIEVDFPGCYGISVVLVNQSDFVRRDILLASKLRYDQLSFR